MFTSSGSREVREGEREPGSYKEECLVLGAAPRGPLLYGLPRLLFLVEPALPRLVMMVTGEIEAVKSQFEKKPACWWWFEPRKPKGECLYRAAVAEACKLKVAKVELWLTKKIAGY